MGLDDQTRRYIDERFAKFEDDVAQAIGVGHLTHDARPAIERSGLEIAYGTVTAVSNTEVNVTLDSDPATAVAMFAMVNVMPGQRVATVLIPPSSGVVLGTLGGNLPTVTINATAGQVDPALEVNDPNGVLLFAVQPSGSIEMLEQAGAPALPPANSVRLYLVDNGGGRTQLYAQFSSGAPQLVAMQP